MSLPFTTSPDTGSPQVAVHSSVNGPPMVESQPPTSSPHEEDILQDSGSIVTNQSEFARNSRFSVRTSYDDLPASESEPGGSVNGGSLYDRIIESQSKAQVNEHGVSPLLKVISCRTCDGKILI